MGVLVGHDCAAKKGRRFRRVSLRQGANDPAHGLFPALTGRQGFDPLLGGLEVLLCPLTCQLRILLIGLAVCGKRCQELGCLGGILLDQLPAAVLNSLGSIRCGQAVDPGDGGIAVVAHPRGGDRGKHAGATLTGRRPVEQIQGALRIGCDECHSDALQGLLTFRVPFDQIEFRNGCLGILLGPFLKERLIVVGIVLRVLRIGCQHAKRFLRILRRRLVDE